MPLGFVLHPGGMPDNSPMFQHWGTCGKWWSVLKGRLMERAPFQPSLRDSITSDTDYPTLKRWAIIARPSGTGPLSIFKSIPGGIARGRAHSGFVAAPTVSLAISMLLLGCLMMASQASAATGRVLKVLPHLLHTNGLHTLKPSLYERDAYQAFLRQHPEKRAGIRFDVEWRCNGPVFDPLKIRVELRGIAAGDLPREATLEQPVKRTGWLADWTSPILSGQDYKSFGEVTAWRVTLWEGDQLLGEQKSFLW